MRKLFWALVALLTFGVALAADHPPRPLNPVPPRFPFEMKRQGLSGAAKVRVFIDNKGRMTKVELIAATHPEFGNAALACVRTWKFEPGVRNGRRVATTVEHSFAFDLPPEPTR